MMHLVSPADGPYICVVAAGKPFESLVNDNIMHNKIRKAIRHDTKSDGLHPPDMIRMVEYPTLKFSRIAAGMISTKAIQLQFLLNQASLSVRFNIIKRRMDANPQGNIKNVEALCGWVAIAAWFVETGR